MNHYPKEDVAMQMLLDFLTGLAIAVVGMAAFAAGYFVVYTGVKHPAAAFVTGLALGVFWLIGRAVRT